MEFILRATLLPSGLFGLPDGKRIVVPIGEDGTTAFSSPILDAVTGKVAGYGTLSEFRKPQDAVFLRKSIEGSIIEIRDNFVSVRVQAAMPQAAFDSAAELLDRICQSLSVQTGQRVSAIRESFEDAQGNLNTAYARKTVRLFSANVYDLKQLQAQLETAFGWATLLDERAKKALFYFEHAQLLEEFSSTLPLHSPHAAFSMATAFLQMFKGLVTIVGEPGVDADHQRRAKQLGLGADFWSSRVQPLGRIRNDKDVAHYSLQSPDLYDARRQFAKAGDAFREAFGAYILSLGGKNGASVASRSDGT